MTSFEGVYRLDFVLLEVRFERVACIAVGIQASPRSTGLEPTGISAVFIRQLHPLKNKAFKPSQKKGKQHERHIAEILPGC